MSYLCIRKKETNNKLNPKTRKGNKIMTTTTTIVKGYTREGRRVKVEERYNEIAVSMGIFVIIEGEEIEKPNKESAISLYNWFVNK